MTLRRLKIFVDVAENGKMSETARKFYISQASVSQSITEMEKEANIKLFERLNKRLYLTAEGKAFLYYAKQILNSEKVLEDFLAQSARIKTLRVGSSLTIGASIFSDIVQQMKLGYPDVQCFATVARNEQIQEKLLSNELDIAFLDRQVSSEDLIQTPFMRDTLVLVCNRQHRFWGRSSVRLSELEGENLVVRDASSNAATILEQLLNQENIPYQIVWRCADIQASKLAVEKGMGITTISRRLVEQEISAGLLWPVEILETNLVRTFNIVYHKDKFVTEQMRGFIRLAEHYEDLYRI